MKLGIGQIWNSKKHPEQDFKIYDGTIDACMDAFQDESIPFDEQPETTKIFFWERTNEKAFDKFVEEKLGRNPSTTYPYAWCGESKKQSLVKRIRDFEMALVK